jgi:hypothetical protein
MTPSERLTALLGQIRGISEFEINQFVQDASEIINTFLAQHATSSNYALLAEHGAVQIGQRAAHHFLRAERASADAARTATIGLLLELATAL